MVDSIKTNNQGPLRICVVGCGRVGITHIEAIKKQPKYATLAGIVDIEDSLVKMVARKYETRYFASLQQALNDTEIDAVILSLPIHLHAEAAINSVASGKHVLVEKPMARNPNEANGMVMAARHKKVNLMVGQSLRYYDALKKAKLLIKNGEIGKIINLIFIFAIFANKETRPSWWRSEKQTGGLVYSMLGSHAIDFIQWIFEGRRVEYVFSAGKSNVDYFEGEDEVNMVLKFGDGTSASCHLSINTEPRIKQCLIIGDKGNIYFEFIREKNSLIGKSPINLYLNGKIIMREKEAKNFENQLIEFTNSILQKREPETSGEKIKSQIEIINAAKLSSIKNCPIYIAEI